MQRSELSYNSNCKNLDHTAFGGKEGFQSSQLLSQDPPSPGNHWSSEWGAMGRQEVIRN